jgi:hypothetical protein
LVIVGTAPPCLAGIMRRRGFDKTPPTGGKPLIMLIEYRSLAALRSLGIGWEANVRKPAFYPV